MSIVCENCLDEIKYHSSTIDSFSDKKFDIYFCNRCFIGKTNLDKDFDFTSYYPKNYYGQDGKKFYFLIEFIGKIKFINNYFILKNFYQKS